MQANSTFIARTGTGRLQWETGGWFGGIIGGSSWLAFGAVALAWKGQHFGAAVSAASWLLVLALACWLWTRRDRVDPFQALACVLLFLSVLMPIVWFICWDIPTDQRVPSLHWVRGVRSAAACSIAPVILLCFFIRERFGSRERSTYIDRTQTGG
jgi:hypothetical protein